MIKITSVSITREPYELPGDGYARTFEAGPAHVSGEFESTREVKVGQRFQVNANRFETPDPGGVLQGVARITRVAFRPVINRDPDVDYTRCPGFVWSGEFEMEGEVYVVSDAS